MDCQSTSPRDYLKSTSSLLPQETTSRLPQDYLKTTSSLPQDYLKTTSRLPQVYLKSTSSLPQDYLKSTSPRLLPQDYLKSTSSLPQDCLKNINTYPAWGRPNQRNQLLCGLNPTSQRHLPAPRFTNPWRNSWHKAKPSWKAIVQRHSASITFLIKSLGDLEVYKSPCSQPWQETNQNHRS